MKVMQTTILKNLAGLVLGLLAVLATTAPGANAKHGAGAPPAPPAAVIAHLELDGTSVGQMSLRDEGGTQYLYLGQNSKDGVAIVDVSKPSQPSIVKHMAWPDQASTGKFKMVGGGLALAEARNTATAEAAPRAETLTVMDLSDAANPRTILSFSGVTSSLVDEAHNLVFITNSEGLWILKHQPEQAIAPETRGCLTADAFNEFANCQ